MASGAVDRGGRRVALPALPGARSGEAAEGGGSVKWEYMTWRISNRLGTPDVVVRFVKGKEHEVKDRTPFYEALRGAGQDGWELVTVTDSQALIFKRPLAEG